jgi:hypothetical protein
MAFLGARTSVFVTTDRAATLKDAAFTQVQNGLSVRTDRWRHTEWDEGKDGAVLYDMDKDPREDDQPGGRSRSGCHGGDFEGAPRGLSAMNAIPS